MVKTILTHLEHAAANYPDKVAFTDSENQVTYSDLLQQAKATGSQFAEILEGQTRLPIIVAAHRKISTIISFLGILYSGNFYVPIDPQMPVARKSLEFEIVKPALVVLKNASDQFLKDLNYTGKTLNLDECIHQEPNETLLNKIQKMMIDVDPLFAIFTSGSTGTPKCVLIKQSSVVQFIDQFSELFGISGNMVLGNQAPLDYDGSVKEICLTLRNQGTMHIIPKMLFSFPVSLFEYLNNHKVNTINWATAALKIIAQHQALDTPKKPIYIKIVFFSGEVMPNKVLNYFRKHFPGTRFVNLYGPTETTFNSSYFVVDRAFSDDEPLPIGIPFPNTDILVLDQDDQQVEKGEIGEICVRGNSLALGYYNNPQATQNAFVQNPLNNEFPERIYRTGDLGKYNEHYELMFISRMDYQIKHMGHRIELGEIEAAVNSLPFVEDSVCIHDPNNKKIILFYQATENSDMQLIMALKLKLPKHMIPNILIYKKKFPKKQNLKIDRKKLEAEYINGID